MGILPLATSVSVPTTITESQAVGRPIQYVNASVRGIIQREIEQEVARTCGREIWIDWMAALTVALSRVQDD